MANPASVRYYTTEELLDIERQKNIEKSEKLIEAYEKIIELQNKINELAFPTPQIKSSKTGFYEIWKSEIFSPKFKATVTEID